MNQTAWNPTSSLDNSTDVITTENSSMETGRNRAGHRHMNMQLFDNLTYVIGSVGQWISTCLMYRIGWFNCQRIRPVGAAVRPSQSTKEYQHFHYQPDSPRSPILPVFHTHHRL